MILMPGHTCGDACWYARDAICHCSCGGANHGILLKGGDRPTRTCKIGGTFYEMVEIGDHNTIEKRRMDETKACGHDWYFDPAGPWVKKTATKTQLANWPELKAYGRDTYILWKQHQGDLP
jgi:hypothetical protein